MPAVPEVEGAKQGVTRQTKSWRGRNLAPSAQADNGQHRYVPRDRVR